MGEYIFRWPADTPEMTYEGLAARLGAAGCDSHDRHGRWCTAKIGTTVTLRWCREAVQVQLYSTTIAFILPGTVVFPNDDPHTATTEWIARIVRDNGIGNGAGRIRRRKSDGPGPMMARGQAGLLCIDYDRDKPVFGPVHQVNRKRMAADRDHRERWAAEMAFRRDHPDEWKADLAAAQPGQGMPDYRSRVDPALWRGSRHRPDLADIC